MHSVPLLPTKGLSCPQSKAGNPLDPLQGKAGDGTFKGAFVVFGTPKFCSLESALTPGTVPSAPDDPVIHE